MNNKIETKNYLPESAGQLMVVDVPTVGENATIADIENLLIQKAANFDTINYVYLVNDSGKLKGIVSIKEIFRSSKTKKLKELSPNLESLITVRTRTDQERVALLAIKHNIKAVPVIDKDSNFLGVVPADVILNILHSESIEDALRFAGAGKMNNPALSIIGASVSVHFRKRLPWLFFGLIGGIFAAFVVGFFESALKEQIILAAFIPAVVYMADAVGTQTETIFIRSMALEHALDFKNYLRRELKVNLLLAVTLGLIMFLCSFFWIKSIVLGMVLGLSFVFTILAAMIIAVTLPLVFKKFKYDPAIASGPFATVIRDITSLLIYFSLASVFF